MCLYHASTEAGWNGRLVEQLQGFKDVCQNRNFAKLQLSAGNVNHRSLPNARQNHVLRNNMKENRDYSFLKLKHKVCCSFNLQQHKCSGFLTRGWRLPNTATRRERRSSPAAFATRTTGSSPDLLERRSPLGAGLPKSKGGSSSFS